MPGIQIVADVVRCSAGILLCVEAPEPVRSFDDIDACRAALPAIITQWSELHRGWVVLARCRFVLDNGLRDPNWPHRPLEPLERFPLWRGAGSG